MGKNIVRFKCSHCSHCCRDVVCLPTPADVIRIVRHTRLHPMKFLAFLAPDQIAGVPKSNPYWLACHGERYLMALVRDETEGCYFLDKAARRCVIYEERPILCRLFPFKLHETREGAYRAFSLHRDVGCPRNRDGLALALPLYDRYREERANLDDYADLVRFFNRRRGRGRRPQDFIELFVVCRRPAGPNNRPCGTRHESSPDGKMGRK